VLVVFSLAQTKLYWYILPAFPAFALAISGLLNDLISKIRLGVRFLALKALTIFRLAKSLKH
jgi:4-amino-4-deoxy-L-arabinose transferase-like glycosyltransferase